jgi:hypothetical protein
MSASTLITRGFGSFGSVSYIITRGLGSYALGEIGELVATISVYPCAGLGEPAISAYAATGFDGATSYPALAATLAVKG